MKALLVLVTLNYSIMLSAINQHNDSLDTKNWDKLSYSQLARHSYCHYTNNLEHSLSNLSIMTLPHETKKLRKRIGYLRLILDLFVHMYPIYNHIDYWEQARQLLDEGYEIVGNFKDLFDCLGIAVQELDPYSYNQQEVNTQRLQVLSWYKKYHFFFTEEIKHIFLSPINYRSIVRNNSKLSRFFWGYHCIVPQAHDNAKIKLTHIVTAMLKKAIISSDKTLKLDNILDHHQQQIFHDQRKLLRYILKIGKVFPKLFTKKYKNSSSYQLIKDAVEKFGQLNDKILMFNTANNKITTKSYGSKEQYQQLETKRQQITHAWINLLSWQKQKKLYRNLAIYNK